MTAPKTLKIIVVGVGLIGPRHARHVLQNPDTDLQAIIDPSPKALAIAKDLGTRHFATIADLFNAIEDECLPIPNGALICTPNHTHARIAVELASKGIHLLIEKPVSSTPEQAKALKIFVESQKVRVLVGHHRRFNPFISEAKSSLPLVGDIIAVQGTWTLKKPKSYFEAALWRTDPQKGGGALLINLIHDIDLMQYLFGPIVKVYAELTKKQRKEYIQVDEGACLIFKFRSGVTGTFVCSDSVTSPFNFEVGTGENPLIPTDDELEGFYRVFGTQGTLSIPDMTLYHQRDNPQSEMSWNHKINRELLIEDKSRIRKIAPFEKQLSHFVNVLKGIADPLCGIEDGISALLSVDAVFRSIKTGQPALVQTVHDVIPDFETVGIPSYEDYS